MKKNETPQPWGIKIEAASALLTVDIIVKEKDAVKKLGELRKQYTTLKKHYKGKGFIDDKLKVTTTPIF